MSDDIIIKTALRLPQDLHSRIHASALQHSRSFNSDIIARLADSFEAESVRAHAAEAFQRAEEAMRQSIGADWLVEHLDISRMVRLKSGATSSDVGMLLKLASQPGCDGVFFGARRDVLNDWVLVAIVRISGVQFLMDQSMLNNARPPRKIEIDHLADELQSLLPRIGVIFLKQPAIDTSDAPPSDAIESLLLLEMTEVQDIKHGLNALLRGSLFGPP
ncbi:Arc family DNA-binding protein [Chitiniphilus eburneus]|uniref:Arc family DNA-binding protein n=1 Tax=Chitiniphilus eburneus TaxID=2571148 RepID=UPI0035D0B7E4